MMTMMTMMTIMMMTMMMTMISPGREIGDAAARHSRQFQRTVREAERLADSFLLFPKVG